jgi:hypothetical protein
MKWLYVLVALQVASMAAVEYNTHQIDGALPDAARQGYDTFAVPMTQNLFQSTATSLTMVNGWKSPTVPNQCSVNLVFSDSGMPTEDTYGFIFELHAPARRYTVADCRNLPERVFRPYVSG